MNVNTVRSLRQLHNYVGIFFAPSLLFFAASGALQTLGLHEDRGGGAPRAWIAAMASIHKDQVLAGEHDHGSPEPPDAPGGREGRPGGPPAHHDEAGFVPLKLFVLMMSLGLITSSGLGIVIAMKNPATRRRTAMLLAVGVILPAALLLI